MTETVILALYNISVNKKEREKMKCNYCGSKKAITIVENKPTEIWRIVLAILLFPIGLLFLFFKGKRLVTYCPECGKKEVEKVKRDKSKILNAILDVINTLLTISLIKGFFKKRKK